MKLREALFATINQFKLTGRKLSQTTGLTETQISEFRGGKRDCELKNFEKLVEALPPEAYHHFWCQLAVDRMDNEQLYELIMIAVTRMKDKPPSQSQEPCQEPSQPERVLVLK